MKGIILAGGSGTRLYPITKSVCKQLLPVYDKPMIYYPLSVLLLAGIKDILLISTLTDISKFENLFGDGSKYGISLSYKIQEKPNGIAEAFILGEDFIGDDDVCLILGDNIFYGNGLSELLERAKNENEGGLVFGYYVKDPHRYGVAEFDANKKLQSISEKPKETNSNYAITGLYFYKNNVIDIAKSLKPSKRGELEITDINKEYLSQGKLTVQLLGRGFFWIDVGTQDSLLDASNYISIVERLHGFRIGCIEEIALSKKLINKDEYKALLADMPDNSYGNYLKSILKEL